MIRSSMSRLLLSWLAAATALALALLGLAFLVLGGHAGPRYPHVELDATRPLPQGDFYRGAYHEPATANPFTTRDAVAERYVLRFTHDALLDVDPSTGLLRPALAESYRVGDAGRTIEFTLREGLVFDDGRAVTIDDARFTAEVARNAAVAPPSAMTLHLRGPRAIEFPDARRIVIRLDEPRFLALHQLATSFRIVQRESWIGAVRARSGGEAGEPGSEAFARWVPAIREPGPATGPYRIARDADGIADWVEGSHLNLVQNPHSWQRRERPRAWNLAGIQLRFVTERAARFAALRNREIDWYYDTVDLEALRASDPELSEHYVRLVYDPIGTGAYHVLWNLRRDALRDHRVRQALTMLFDREAIVASLMHGMARQTASWFPPGAPEHPRELAPWAFDVAAARAKLAEAGFGDGARALELDVLCQTDDDTSRRILELARPSFKQAGVVLRAQPLDAHAIAAREDAGDFDGIVELVQFPGPIDPYESFHSTQNLVGYANPDMDRVLEQARVEFDESARLALYERFNRLFHEEQPVTLLAVPRVQILLSSRFRDVRITAFGAVPEAWWVPADQQLVR